jgi:putative FmdB family regulatory protein
MPIYEYEPVDHDCLMCEGKVSVIQGINEEPLTHCPDCGMPVRRVISKASFKLSKGDFDQAAKKGFTTFRRSEQGVWEKIAGEGVDGIVSPDKVEPVERPAKTLDLDSSKE